RRAARDPRRDAASHDRPARPGAHAHRRRAAARAPAAPRPTHDGRARADARRGPGRGRRGARPRARGGQGTGTGARGGGIPPRARIRRGARYKGIEERVIAALSHANVLDRANLMSFNPAVVERARELAPRLRTTLLVSAMHVRLARAHPADTIAWAQRFGATDVGLKHTLVDAGVIGAPRAAGVKVGAWTVNDEPEMRRLIALGIDVLTSDRPDLALRVLGRA